MQKQRSYYLDLRREFEPTGVKLVIVAESPPESESGKYFYNPGGTVSELLFKELMKQLCIQPKTKPEGLREFQNRGWVLVDATYEQVNKHNERDADLVIVRDYPQLSGLGRGGGGPQAERRGLQQSVVRPPVREGPSRSPVAPFRRCWRRSSKTNE